MLVSAMEKKAEIRSNNASVANNQLMGMESMRRLEAQTRCKIISDTNLLPT